MKIFFGVLYTLLLVVITDMYFEYVLSRDYAHILLVFLGGVIVLLLWVLHVYRTIKDLINYFNKQKTKDNDN